MNNDLTIMEKMITMPLAGETQAGSLEGQSAGDSRLGVTDCCKGGRLQTGQPAHLVVMVIQNFLVPGKTYLPKARHSLDLK